MKTTQKLNLLLIYLFGNMVTELVILIYQITQNFPREEIYSLTDQMKRSATSITSNIAEGFGRRTYKEKVQFYYQAQGSLTELKNQILIAKDIGYVEQILFNRLVEKTNTVHKLLQGLITKTKLFLNQIWNLVRLFSHL